MYLSSKSSDEIACVTVSFCLNNTNTFPSFVLASSIDFGFCSSSFFLRKGYSPRIIVRKHSKLTIDTTWSSLSVLKLIYISLFWPISQILVIYSEGAVLQMSSFSTSS